MSASDVLTRMTSLNLSIQAMSPQSHVEYQLMRASIINKQEREKQKDRDVEQEREKEKEEEKEAEKELAPPVIVQQQPPTFQMPEKLKKDHFDFLTTLGTGTFARVWLVKPARSPAGDGELYALKVLRKADVIRLKQCEHTKNERVILSHCRKHPFITTLIASWSDWNSVYLLLDYAPGGELFTYLRRSFRFPVSTTQFYAAEITSVFGFLHRHGVVYRDLKPENVMIDARGHIRLVDFGFSKVIGDFETYTLCGTPEYIAPEVLLTKGHGKAVDWWALGVFIYELSCGYPPFWDESTPKIYEKIVKAEVSFPSGIDLPESFKDIVRKLCRKDLHTRLGNHGGAEDVKNHEFFKGLNWQELEAKRKMGPIVPKLRQPDDTSYFETYPPPEPEDEDDYTIEMYDQWENYFRDF